MMRRIISELENLRTRENEKVRVCHFERSEKSFISCEVA